MEENNNLLQEVQKELAEERLYKFLSSNFRYIIIFAAVVLIGLCSRLWYNSYLENKQAHDGAELLKLAMSGDISKAKQSLQTLSASDTNFAAIANLELADIALSQGDTKTAADHYNRIANDNSYSTIIRDIARLNLIQLDPFSEASQKLARKLIDSDSIAKYNAMEYVILALKQQGNQEYTKLIDTLIASVDAPASLKIRVSSYR